MNPIFITSAVTALATTVATKSLESPLESLNDLWDGIVGHTIAAWSEKRKLQAFYNVEVFKQELAKQGNRIPVENIQEPQISIVGPTLEASKYYMDEEELRIMFAKLIIASMDSRKNGYVQHSFVEIIKQLTPLDAKVLTSLTTTKPIVNISEVFRDKVSTITLYSDLFLFSDNIDVTLSSISINNLERLGLVNISYDKTLTDDKVYNPFKKTQEYLAVERECKINGDSIPEIQGGVVTTTNFGEAFVKVCIL